MRDEWKIFKAHADLCKWPEANARCLFDNIARIVKPESLTRILQATAKQMLSGHLQPTRLDGPHEQE